MTASSSRIGRIGERMAARHLRDLGMAILDSNWRCQVGDLRGEIDLVARDGDAIVFCEVKTRRRPTPAGPLEGITPTKVRQIRRLAGVWLTDNRARVPDLPNPLSAPRHGWASVRIDAIGISWPADGGRPVIVHVRGVG